MCSVCVCVCCTVTSLFALASVQLPNLSWPLCCRYVRYFSFSVLFFSFHYILVTVLLLFFLACLPLLPFLSSPGCCTSSSILTLWIGCLTACLGLCVCPLCSLILFSSFSLGLLLICASFVLLLLLNLNSRGSEDQSKEKANKQTMANVLSFSILFSASATLPPHLFLGQGLQAKC